MGMYDWKYLIQPLNDTEEEHIAKILSDPVVVKYFKNIAYDSMIEQSMTPVEDLRNTHDDKDYRILAAYFKGKLEIAENILSYLDEVNKPKS